MIAQRELNPERPVWRRALDGLLFWGSATVETLNRMTEKPDVVVVYGGYSSYALRVLRWARANGVRAMVDIVEWYDPSHMPLGRFGPFSASFSFAFHHIYKRFDGAIVISRLLERRFSRWLPCAVVPPTTQLSSSAKARGSDVLRLVYAGTPGKKDLLGTILDAVAKASADGVKVRLDVVGVRDDQLDSFATTTVDRAIVKAWGRLSRNEVLEVVRSADFSVLVRRNAKFADAGFPTKFVESCSLATPVIANITSDLGAYLQDGVSGIVVEMPTVDSVASSIARASKISGDAYYAMSERASQLCREGFHPDAYAERMNSFLAVILSGRNK